MGLFLLPGKRDKANQRCRHDSKSMIRSFILLLMKRELEETNGAQF